jgi:hypothetical protein
LALQQQQQMVHQLHLLMFEESVANVNYC